VLSNEIDNAPAAIALLDMRVGQRRDLRSSEAAAEQNGQDCAIAQALHGIEVWRVEQALSLAH
jgi:SLT domain-containing protein